MGVHSDRLSAGAAVAGHGADEMADGHELAESVVGPARREQTKVLADSAGQLRIEKQWHPERTLAELSSIVEGLLEPCVEVDGEKIALLQLMRLDSMIND